ncbi:hypothetical protein V8E51_013785 [Hyaloscypha variabilis]
MSYLINHIFLPPKLPQEDDLSFEYESAMLDIVIDCPSKFKGHIGDYNIDVAIGTSGDEEHGVGKVSASPGLAEGLDIPFLRMICWCSCCSDFLPELMFRFHAW